MDVGLPYSDEPTLYMESLTVAWRSFRAGEWTRTEYLEEVSRLTREQKTVGTKIDGQRVRVDAVKIDNELRAFKWNEYAGLGRFRTRSTDPTAELAHWQTGPQPGLSTRALAGMMDAQDAEKKRAAQTDEGR